MAHPSPSPDPTPFLCVTYRHLPHLIIVGLFVLLSLSANSLEHKLHEGRGYVVLLIEADRQHTERAGAIGAHRDLGSNLSLPLTGV